MKTKSAASDTEKSGALRALRRAAAQARKLSRQTGTPFYIFRDGKVVDLNSPSKRRLRKRRDKARK